MTGPVSAPSADREIFGAALRTKLVRTELAAAVKLFNERALQCADRCIGIALRPAERLLDNAIDDPEGRADRPP